MPALAILAALSIRTCSPPLNSIYIFIQPPVHMHIPQSIFIQPPMEIWVNLPTARAERIYAARVADKRPPNCTIVWSDPYKLGFAGI